MAKFLNVSSHLLAPYFGLTRLYRSCHRIKWIRCSAIFPFSAYNIKFSNKMPIMDKAFISHFAKFNANAVTIRNEN